MNRVDIASPVGLAFSKLQLSLRSRRGCRSAPMHVDRSELNPSPPPSAARVEGRLPAVLILGAPRSGTSWLGKIFDSHPAVIYRHEPDSVVRPTEFPLLCPIDEISQYTAAVRRYVARLVAVRQVKASGTLPVFPKPFQPLAAHMFRHMLALGLRVSESLAPRAAWPRRTPIPDFVRKDAEGLTYVIKSVTLIGATALLASALPESRIIAIFRHPCGQIASVKRQPSNPLLTKSELTTPLSGPRALELGLSRERYARLPELERHVWAWALLHDKLFREATGIPNVRLLSYEDLCRDPIEGVRALMAFAGLPWAEETRRFIERSTRGGGRERYFGVFRNPMEAAMKWKQQLDAAEIVRYMAIVEEVLPHRFSC
jgi:hypothetical protein